MAPAWVDLAKELGNDESVLIGEVDCTVESSVCQDNEVKGYPTLKAFKGGNLIEKYAGGRDLNSFKAAVNPRRILKWRFFVQLTGRLLGVVVRVLI